VLDAEHFALERLALHDRLQVFILDRIVNEVIEFLDDDEGNETADQVKSVVVTIHHQNVCVLDRRRGENKQKCHRVGPHRRLEFVLMVANELHYVQLGSELVNQRYMQDCRANESAEDHLGL
jgi:hypothetical protein